ncbi:MAG TPA: hypothetical protein VJ276_04055 [Thermoanaerobaculia bacterium]|nr:hypothetical protein [Thermoanaerobaculia bacterium]
MDFDLSPDLAAMWFRIGLAALCIAGAVLLEVRRRLMEQRSRIAIHALLIFATFSAIAAWEAYFPSCPRGWVCCG